jgi:hypothetical protein
VHVCISILYNRACGCSKCGEVSCPSAPGHMVTWGRGAWIIWCYIICFVELFLVAGAFSHEYSGNLAYALPSACKPEACTPIRVLACVPGRTCGAPP